MIDYETLKQQEVFMLLCTVLGYVTSSPPCWIILKKESNMAAIIAGMIASHQYTRIYKFDVIEPRIENELIKYRIQKAHKIHAKTSGPSLKSIRKVAIPEVFIDSKVLG
jgi:hypothetical protein